MTWDTVALIGRAHQGDKEARDILFHENTGLIYSVAHRFLGRGAEMEDLFQIGSIGLLKAVDKFDLSYDVKFSTYAVPMIAGEIKRFLRDDGMLKVSRSIKENQYRIYKMREKLEKNLGREPTVTELAEELGMTPEEIAMASDAATEVESYTSGGRNGIAAFGQASGEGKQAGKNTGQNLSGRITKYIGNRRKKADLHALFL